jgi:hypothetical protein
MMTAGMPNVAATSPASRRRSRSQQISWTRDSRRSRPSRASRSPAAPVPWKLALMVTMFARASSGDRMLR